ncbi:MAG: hypothetical protein MR021_04730 [Clostridiales bacterium]|nr:hypothetical protein [Clostridiales bacterium]
MMDQFLEEVVTKQGKSQGLQSVLIALANVAMVAFAILAFMYFNTAFMMLSQAGFSADLILPVVMFLALGGLAVLLFLRRDRLRTEYEYTFTNGVLDFAQVFNNKKRKPLGTMNLKNIEACGKVASGSFQRYINMPGVKRTNWFLNRQADLFYLYFTKEGQKRIIIIEPSEDMQNYIRRAVGQGVYQVN